MNVFRVKHSPRIRLVTTLTRHTQSAAVHVVVTRGATRFYEREVFDVVTGKARDFGVARFERKPGLIVGEPNVTERCRNMARLTGTLQLLVWTLMNGRILRRSTHG